MQPTLARFAPAKINLFLEVAGKRPDGFHEITTVMETIAVGDLVEVAPARELSVATNRDDVPSGEGNAAWKIVRAAEEALRRPLPAAVRIVKHLPPGSGLGAGSSDAVHALLLVLELHGVRPPRDSLGAIAAAVGSDTSFFLDGGLALCTGRGEAVRPLPQRGVRHLVLVLPSEECSTARVYGALEVSGPRHSPAALREALARGSGLAAPPDDGHVFNRLEEAAEHAYPGLVARRSHLRTLAGRAPHLSGSGGTFFFLCASQREARRLAGSLRAADASLDVRETASYRGHAPAVQP
jgi:4-diphosphocytidyl-2-C-methyl-D-erythritol kinase